MKSAPVQCINGFVMISHTHTRDHTYVHSILVFIVSLYLVYLQQTITCMYLHFTSHDVFV